uniref:Uncharacterized protein n=1 Tax=Aegilops tauschii TaxID=37682 RepID=M8BJ41_AEGTA
MTVPETEMPASARRRLFLARFDALIFLHCGLLWVLCAVYLALVIARLALGQLEIPPALWAASWACAYIVLCLTPVSTFLVGARSSRSLRSPYDTTDANKVSRKNFPFASEYDPAMIGVLVSAAFMLLAIDYDKVVGLLGVEGCQRERIGSIVRDVGLMGGIATCCFVTLPTMILRQWRMKMK